MMGGVSTAVQIGLVLVAIFGAGIVLVFLIGLVYEILLRRMDRTEAKRCKR